MTETRPIQPTPVGALRFNTDSAKLEYFDGNEYVNITTTSPNQHTGGTRGLFGAGHPATNKIDFINIDTTGNAQDFGNRTTGNGNQAGACSSRVRGLFAGGHSNNNIIDFVTIASTGDATNFGDLTVARGYSAGGSNSTRGLTGGGWGPSNSDVIDYVTIQSTGDAVDFGNLTVARQVDATVNSPTRVVFTGGCTGPSPFVIGTTDRLDYVTTSTLGNAADFGDLNQETFGTGACSNAIRGLIMGGGGSSSSKLNNIQFITIATLGNALDFGDTPSTHYYGASCASPTRAIVAGGSTPSTIDVVDYVQIMTTGNGVDFGNLTANRDQMTGFSNGHGGLG